MQGIQSSIVPEKTENHGLMPGNSGPLEAAKRYLDRQRESEATLAAMEDDDGRPAWLRRWQGEASRQATRTASARIEASGGIEETVEEPIMNTLDTRESDQVAAVNGYTGQSIEAAFAFETVFHFETELEAEETEDWLDLSGEGPQPGSPSEAFDRPQDLTEAAQGLDTEEAEKKVNQASGGQFYAAGTSPNPQAVRAAIFRLAQDSSSRWTPVQELAETSGRGGAGDGASLETLTKESPATADKLSANADAEFADVARQVWSVPEAIDSADHASTSKQNRELDSSSEGSRAVNESAELLDAEQSIAESRTQALSEPLLEAMAVDLKGSASRNRGVEGASVTHETARGALRTQAQETGHGEGPRLARTREHELPVGYDLPHPDVSHSSPSGAEDSAANLGQEWSLNRALGEIRKEIRQEVRDEMGSETRSEAAGSVGVEAATLPWSEPTPARELRGAQSKASAAPALAHDANNLLSALKLYSELLALSGVLQARHSHYAQDLKLLAARSEVLIDRLLASCSLAERDARELVHNHVSDGSHHASFNSGNETVVASVSGPEGSVSNGSNLLSRGIESVAKQWNRFAPEEDMSKARLDVAAAPSLEPVFDPEIGESSLGRLERLQTRTIEREAVKIGHPEDEQVDAAVTELPNKAIKDPSVGVERSQVTDSGADAGPGTQPINLVDLLTRWGGLLSMIARGPVEVAFGPQAALPIQVDEEAMERILVNLVHNAMTATRNGGAIRIGAGRSETRRPARSEDTPKVRARPEGKVVLTVDDSGCGMSEAQIAKVLGTGHATVHSIGLAPDTASDIGRDGARDEPLRSGLNASAGRSREQITLTSGPPAGRAGDNRRHGMGLQIVRELVSASGGELAIYSRRGVGTRIEIQWPTLQHSVEWETVSGGISPPPVAVKLADFDANSGPVLTGQRRPPQTADDSGRSSGGFTINRVGQGLEGAIAC